VAEATRLQTGKDRMVRSVFIKLNNEEEVEIFELFKKVASKNYTDATKTTKRLWLEYIEENNGKGA
jgi:hypothetical protein